MEREEVERLLASLEDYELAIPDELVGYYLMRAGFKCDDIRVQRLVALAAQKFLADIGNDAVTHCKLRQQNAPGKSKGAPKETRNVLTADDLEKALREYGVSLKKPPYYADTVAPVATATARAADAPGKPTASSGGAAAGSGATGKGKPGSADASGGPKGSGDGAGRKT